MSTRAQIAIQTGPDEWAHVYCHFDGYPGHMLKALSTWQPEDILAARELRSVAQSQLETFEPARAPVVHSAPQRDFAYTYVFDKGRWAEWEGGQ
ncbi:hypothetical protein FAP39_15810 [Shimia litoralis]|uniref:Uncharacterized protein n=1 Tax=Shimia litoralis TaxID=420403 RepID=A0A4U7MSQ0_9RHOB|nr:hypothetical protein [Shimia litoralis]TKZ16019.1 hypothetical protein FAP39_15810 [Shimia litoralis]